MCALVSDALGKISNAASVAGWVMVITFCFCMGNLDDILASPTGYPFLQVFYNATKTSSGATAMGSFVVVMTCFGNLTAVASASRQLWAFSRDKALPFSFWFSRKIAHR